MKSIAALFTLSVLLFACSSARAEDGAVLVADFDNAQPTNNLGKGIEIWLREDGSDTTQSCQMSFVKDDALGNPEGHSLRLDYDVDSPNPAYNGMRMDLNFFNATPHKRINFYIKGDKEKGYPNRIKIELIGMNKRPSPHIFEGVTNEWRLISIPLEEFMLIQDWTTLEKFVVVFADIVNNPKAGTIYIDHIYFSE